jgi:hypothetical protein
MAVRTFRSFGKMQDAVKIPNLVVVQTESYAKFLQREVAPTKRADQGLESLFREIFPIESYDKKMTLEYLYYELEKPHYTPLECRQLRLTYAYPLKIHCRLRSESGADSHATGKHATIGKRGPPIRVHELPLRVWACKFSLRAKLRFPPQRMATETAPDATVRVRQPSECGWWVPDAVDRPHPGTRLGGARPPLQLPAASAP